MAIILSFSRRFAHVLYSGRLPQGLRNNVSSKKNSTTIIFIPTALLQSIFNIYIFHTLHLKNGVRVI